MAFYLLPAGAPDIPAATVSLPRRVAFRVAVGSSAAFHYPAFYQSLLAAVPKLGEMSGKPYPEPMKLMGRAQDAIAPIAGTQDPLLQVNGLTTRFPVKGGFFRRLVANVHAVEDVSFTLNMGQTLSLVGESGCG